MKIKLIKFDNFKAPRREHFDDSGADIFAAVSADIAPGKVFKMPTGLGVEIPCGYDGVIHCKSGLSSKGIWLANAPIDAGYRGEIHAIMINTTDNVVHINEGDKVGQLVIRPVIYADFVDDLGSKRGDSGFGSTGNR